MLVSALNPSNRSGQNLFYFSGNLLDFFLSVSKVDKPFFDLLLVTGNQFGFVHGFLNAFSGGLEPARRLMKLLKQFLGNHQAIHIRAGWRGIGWHESILPAIFGTPQYFPRNSASNLFISASSSRTIWSAFFPVKFIGLPYFKRIGWGWKMALPLGHASKDP
jgi:hypothetical protein